MKKLHERLSDAYGKAQESLSPENFKMLMHYVFGVFEGIAVTERPIADRDVRLIERRIEDMITDQRVDAGVCVHCGGQIKVHQPAEPMFTTSPADPVEYCGDCGQKVD